MMPVYFATFHAYRSRKINRPEGYFKRGSRGKKPPNDHLSSYREASASNVAVIFCRHQQQVLIACAKDICEKRGWLLYAVSVVPMHVHLLVGWHGTQDADANLNRIKSLLGKALSDDLRSKGNRWFSRGGHTEQVQRQTPRRINNSVRTQTSH